VLEQVDAFELTTPTVVARDFFGGSTLRALAVLEPLEAAGILRQGRTSAGSFFALPQTSFTDRHLEDALGLLSFCRRGPVKRDVFSTARYEEFVSRFEKAFSVPPPRGKPLMYVQERRVHLVRLHNVRRGPNELNTALRALQDFVSAPKSFGFWWNFAKRDSLALTYLVPDEARRAELSLWLDFHPLQSRAGGSAVTVRAEVEVAEFLQRRFPES
jgi:hypothetical protein